MAYVYADVGGRTLRLSTLDRVLWPATGFTKRAMLDYYARAADALLPHLAGRPCTLGRYPEGAEARGWFQTNCRGSPPWLTTYELVGANGALQRLCVIDELAALVWAANGGAIELHPFLATVSRLDEPTLVIFDLDPGPPAELLECARAALLVRDALTEAGLRSWPKTSGWSGLHVAVPLNSPATYDDTKSFARSLAERLARDQPGLVVARNPKALRRGRVLVDWAQNGRLRSTVVPYSLRATEIPLVSTPLRWDEVERAVEARDESRLLFGPEAVLERLERHGDLFAPVLTVQQRLRA